MKRCDECGGKILVIDSRGNNYGIRRRRECQRCGKRTTTIETLVVSNATAAAIDGRGCAHFYRELNTFLREYDPKTRDTTDGLPIHSPIRVRKT